VQEKTDAMKGHQRLDVQETQREWIKPSFEKTLLKDALSSYSGHGDDGTYYS